MEPLTPDTASPPSVPVAQALRVLVVADDPLVRAGLASLLYRQAGWTVAGQTGARDDLSTSLAAANPDVLLWDLGWGTADGLERMLDTSDASPPIVALVEGESQAAEAWTAGARGLLPRDADGPSLVAALRAAVQGLAVVDARLTTALRVGSGQAPGVATELTGREIEVLRLLAEGLANKAIAGRLAISEHTVKFHINSILGKLGAHSRTEAVVKATRLGIVLI